MAHYIDKDAINAEIDNIWRYYIEKDDLDNGWNYALAEIRSFLDTLEVKEDTLFTEKKTEKERAEDYIDIFDKKFGGILPQLKGEQLAEFKKFVNICEQTFHIKYFDYHATQGKLFEKLALLWAAWGKDYLTHEVNGVDLEKEINNIWNPRFNLGWDEKSLLSINHEGFTTIAKHFFRTWIRTQKGKISYEKYYKRICSSGFEDYTRYGFQI